MIAIFLALVLAVQARNLPPRYYIGPEGYTLDTVPLLFYVADEDYCSESLTGYNTRCSFHRCFEDKAYWFRIIPNNNENSATDRTKRTFTMQYYTSSQCTAKDPNRSMKLVYYADGKAEGDIKEDTDYTSKFPLWVWYSASGHGSQEFSIIQYSRPGCVDAMGFEFRFTSNSCYHHLYDSGSQCKGVDSIAKFVYDWEKWGSGQYHVNSNLLPEADIKPDENAQYAEGDPSFFYYLNMVEVLKTKAECGYNKFYQFTKGQLKIYKNVENKNGKCRFEYWQDAMKNPSRENQITTAISCSSPSNCNSETTGTEYYITSECVAGQVFVTTCDDLIRIKKDGVTENCDSVFNVGDSKIVLATDKNRNWKFNDTDFFVNMPYTTCKDKSCTGERKHATEYFYREQSQTFDKNKNIINVIYQYVEYKTKAYTLQVQYADNTYTKINEHAVVIAEHSETACIPKEQKEIHFYKHLSMDECNACHGYGVSRADFYQIAECHDNQYFYVVDTGVIDVYYCNAENTTREDIKTADGEKDQTPKLHANIAHGCQILNGMVFYVYYDVSLSTYDSFTPSYEPENSDNCIVYDLIPEPLPVDPNKQPECNECPSPKICRFTDETKTKTECVYPTPECEECSSPNVCRFTDETMKVSECAIPTCSNCPSTSICRFEEGSTTETVCIAPKCDSVCKSTEKCLYVEGSVTDETDCFAPKCNTECTEPSICRFEEDSTNADCIPPECQNCDSPYICQYKSGTIETECILPEPKCGAGCQETYICQYTQDYQEECVQKQAECTPACVEPAECEYMTGSTQTKCVVPEPKCDGGCTGLSICQYTEGSTTACVPPSCDKTCTHPTSCQYISGTTATECAIPVCDNCNAPSICEFEQNSKQTKCVKLECNPECTAPSVCQFEEGTSNKICKTPYCEGGCPGLAICQFISGSDKSHCVDPDCGGRCTELEICKYIENSIETECVPPECEDGCTAPEICQYKEGSTTEAHCVAPICDSECLAPNMCQFEENSTVTKCVAPVCDTNCTGKTICKFKPDSIEADCIEPECEGGCAVPSVCQYVPGSTTITECVTPDPECTPKCTGYDMCQYIEGTNETHCVSPKCDPICVSPKICKFKSSGTNKTECVNPTPKCDDCPSPKICRFTDETMTVSECVDPKTPDDSKSEGGNDKPDDTKPDTSSQGNATEASSSHDDGCLRMITMFFAIVIFMLF